MRRFIKSPIALVASCLVWCVFSYLAFPLPWAVAAAAGIILAHVLSQTVLVARIACGGHKDGDSHHLRISPREAERDSVMVTVTELREADRMSFISFLVPLAFLPTYFAGARPYLAQSLLLLGCGLAVTVVAKMMIFGVRGRDVLEWLDKRAMRLCVISTIAITLTMTALMLVKYYTYNYYGWVLAATNQALWGTANGMFSMSSLWDFQYIYSHGSYILLGLVPFYAILPSPLVYMAAKSLFIGLAAIPLFKIGRMYLRPSLALLVVLIFMLYPGIVSQHVIEENRAFAPFFVLFMFYFFLKGHWKRFMLFLLLSMTVKLSLMPALLLLPLYALVRRPTGVTGDNAGRSALKWAVVPGLLLVAYVVVSFLWLAPLGQGDGSYYFLKRYGQFGSTGGEVIVNMLRHPGRVLAMLTARENLVYYYLFLLPFGLILVFRSPEWLFAIPVLLVNLLQDLYARPMIGDHYTAEAAPFLAVAFVITLYRITRRVKVQRVPPATGCRPAPAGIAVTMILLVALTAGTFQYWFNADDYVSKPYVEAQQEALRLVPERAKVQASWHFLPELSSREGLYMHNITDDNERKWLQNEGVDYFLLDTHYEALTRNQQIIGPIVLRKLSGNPEKYDRLYCRDGIYVFRRREKAVNSDSRRTVPAVMSPRYQGDFDYAE